MLYCTTGVLLEKLIMAKSLDTYTHVILDEVHERDIDMDFLLTLVRELLRVDQSNTKLILMSATFDVNCFTKYFSAFDELFIPKLIKISSEDNFKTEKFFLDDLEMSRI